MARQTARRQQPIWVFILLILIGLAWWYFERPHGPVTTSGECGDKFAYGRPVASTANQTTFLCRAGYAVLHDDARKVPLYSAEHLKGHELARNVARSNDFRPDPDLPPDARAELNDYARSGYSRGHMTPAADAADEQEMHQTFYLSNMVPQNQVMNEGIWAGLESATRACAKKLGELYVITGPVFTGQPQTVGPDRVAVPDQIYKIAFDEKSGQYRAFVIPNRALPRRSDFAPYEKSITDVEKLTGLNFFPQATFDEGVKGSLCPETYGG